MLFYDNKVKIFRVVNVGDYSRKTFIYLTLDLKGRKFMLDFTNAPSHIAIMLINEIRCYSTNSIFCQPQKWRNWLEHYPRMQKVGCANPSRDRP